MNGDPATQMTERSTNYIVALPTLPSLPCAATLVAPPFSLPPTPTLPGALEPSSAKSEAHQVMLTCAPLLPSPHTCATPAACLSPPLPPYPPSSHLCVVLPPLLPPAPPLSVSPSLLVLSPLGGI